MNKVIVLIAAIVFGLMLLSDLTHADGKADFEAKCKMCHGTDGKGNPAMAASLGPNLNLTAGSGDCVAIVTNGKQKMPAYKDKLSAEQIVALCDYIKTLK